MRRVLIPVLASGLVGAAAAAELTGRVVAVPDGDSLTLQVDGTKIGVRLDGIDAPEAGQRYGRSARRSLTKLCAGKDASVVERGKDEQGRLVGSVTCAGVDVNAEQVKRGLAWVFQRYLPLGSPLYELESNARLREIGLWRDKDPVPPWAWRKQNPKGQQSSAPRPKTAPAPADRR